MRYERARPASAEQHWHGAYSFKTARFNNAVALFTSAIRIARAGPTLRLVNFICPGSLDALFASSPADLH
jgi:hypothetical protein